MLTQRSQSQARRLEGFLSRHLRALIFSAAVLVFSAVPAEAIPYFARTHALSCRDCHSIPPKLNARGESFLARGYRAPARTDRELIDALPVSAWITARYEYRESSEGSSMEEAYLPKVELISGGPIGERASYFIEWRISSFDLRGDGTLRDRSGRFEDAFIDWELRDRVGLRIGQFRSLNQYDVSLRLSVSEPLIFSGGLPGKPAADPRIQSLRGFAPSARSPGVALEYQSVEGAGPADGLFHFLTVPFVGELSLPLSTEARREASFELHGPPKGVFLETFYRRRLNSFGAHAFIGDDRRMVTAVGRLNRGDFYATAGLGVDDADGRNARTRSSIEFEYIHTRHDRLRSGLGFRAEHIANAGRDPAYIPYIVIAGPNEKYSFLLQAEARFEGGRKIFVIDLSSFF